ncbi:hypothetical protein CYY_002048 [Polysphondylium violaceum]|uniref:R3H domain-containing protein n=1 Tax=Polysphondylium violaceum TaxID=133409 RepID=A0A8J4V3A6_9MYCE|nr:hypothetical protein CYY_002048 [Polysphondylium violaceum]
MAEIKRISEILWEQMKINDESDKKTLKGDLPSTRFPKKKKIRSNRDSLAFRESPGKAGSKRYNRYMNTQFLKTAGSLGNQFEAEMDFQIMEHNKSLFYQDQTANSKYWDQFLNITFDKEEELIGQERNKHYRHHNNNHQNNHITASFSKLQRNIRPLFKKPFLQDSVFINEIESEILCFINNHNQKTIEYSIQDPYKRLILHGLVQYYSLFSKSHTTSNGQRNTVIRKPKVMPPFPSQTIAEYLVSESKRSKLLAQKQQQSSKKNNILKKTQLLYSKKRRSTINNTNTTTATTQVVV